MQAALWYGPEEIKLETIDVPVINAGEVLVKIGAALTCGTDFKLFRRGHALLVKNIPSPFGHELAGTIVEIGSQVKGFSIGERVVAANSAPCGECFFCGKSQPNLCENLEFLNGAYAEYISIPARIVQKNLYKIPDNLDFRYAAFAEPLACVLHCFERIALNAGDTLCVIGVGTCGLLFTQLAKLRGARVIAVGRSEEKLRVASQLGADATVSINEVGYRDKIRQWTTGEYGPDVVVEVAGQPTTWQLATELVRKGGQVWFYGGCAKGTEVALDTHRVHYDEIMCSGIFHHTPYYFKKSLELIVNQKINLGPLIQGEKRLSELHQVFQKGMTSNPLKLAIIP